MAILSRAMAITGLTDKLPGGGADAALVPFADAAEVSPWAREFVADAVAAGIVQGRDGSLLDPQALVTRAEAAAMVQRLLRQSDLI